MNSPVSTWPAWCWQPECVARVLHVLLQPHVFRIFGSCTKLLFFPTSLRRGGRCLNNKRLPVAAVMDGGAAALWFMGLDVAAAESAAQKKKKKIHYSAVRSGFWLAIKLIVKVLKAAKLIIYTVCPLRPTVLYICWCIIHQEKHWYYTDSNSDSDYFYCQLCKRTHRNLFGKSQCASNNLINK